MKFDDPNQKSIVALESILTDFLCVHVCVCVVPPTDMSYNTMSLGEVDYYEHFLHNCNFFSSSDVLHKRLYLSLNNLNIYLISYYRN